MEETCNQSFEDDFMVMMMMIVAGRFGAVGTIVVIGTAVVLYHAFFGVCCLIQSTAVNMTKLGKG